MTRPRPGSVQQALYFKAYEIEELADVYFFRPAGLVFAYAARALRLTPTQVSAIAGGVGVAGGALLYDPRMGLWAFALLILHSVLDSSDGQLARMTGRTSEFGRLVDGIIGYVTYAAVFVAIVAAALHAGAGRGVLAWAGVAALSAMIQAQMYDYHRTSYTHCVIRRQPPRAGAVPLPSGLGGDVLRVYGDLQRLLIGGHAAVEQAIAARAPGGVVTDADVRRYRACFYWPVRGWNVMGDNTRFYAIGVCAWLGRLDWFFVFLAVPLNVTLVLLWIWQARADRRFLSAV